MTKKKKKKFRIYAPNANRVFVSGEFNNWSMVLNSLTLASEGFWETTVELDPGEYEYKFIIDGAWQIDQNADKIKKNVWGTENSVVVVE